MKPVRFVFYGMLFLLAFRTSQAQTFAPGHIQAAEALLAAMNLEKSMNDMIETMLNVQLQQSPELQPYAGVMSEFLHKYMSWETLRPEFVTIYAEAFTENELKEITAFYQTDTGRKVSALLPELTARGARLGEAAVKDHLPELEEMIRQKSEELGGQEQE